MAVLLDGYDEYMLDNIEDYLWFPVNKNRYEDGTVRKLLGLSKGDKTYDNLFGLLYKAHPIGTDPDIGSLFIEKLRSTDLYKDIRRRTMFDLLFTHFAAEKMSELMKKEMRDQAMQDLAKNRL